MSFVEVKYVAKQLTSFVFQVLETLFIWYFKCEQMSGFAFLLLVKNQYLIYGKTPQLCCVEATFL